MGADEGPWGYGGGSGETPESCPCPATDLCSQASQKHSSIKQEKRRELRLKRFWRSPKTTSSEDSNGYESPTRTKASSAGGSSDAQRFNHLHYTSLSQGSGTSSSAGGATASGAGPTTLGQSGNSKPSCSLPLLQVWPSQAILVNIK
ncbi:GD12300 [Drosophila simulans]|uniref:GD12300 n=1 Tax=Drosophila simulans TaxID=7240 RepID=B4QQD1_DROSI|nr:GD12300 [Drosophila simulans]